MINHFLVEGGEENGRRWGEDEGKARRKERMRG